MGVIVLRDQHGATKAIDETDHASLGYYLDHGWAQEKPEEAAERSVHAGKIEGYGLDTIAGKTKAAIAELLGGATFNALTTVEASTPQGREQVGLRREELPTITGASNALGMVGPALLSGGAGVLAPSGAVAKLGAGIIERGAAKGILGRTAAAVGAGAIEGVPASVGGYISQQAIEDKPLAASGFLGAIGNGIMWGGGGGAIASLTSSAAQAASRLFAKSEVTEAAAAAAERKAVSEIRGSLDDSKATEGAARTIVRNHRHGRVLSDPEAAQMAENVRLAHEAEAQRAATYRETTQAPDLPDLPTSRAYKSTGEVRVPPAPRGAPVDTTLDIGPTPLGPATPAVTPTAPTASGSEDELLSKLSRSSERLAAGEPISSLTAEANAGAGRGQTWNPMLHRHIVGGGSTSDIEQQGWRAAIADPRAEMRTRMEAAGRARSARLAATEEAAPPKMLLRGGKLVTEEEFAAGRLPPRQPYKSVDEHIDDAVAELNPEVAKVRDAADELAGARAEVEAHLGTAQPEQDLEGLLGSSVKRLQAGESIGALSREARPTVTGADIVARAEDPTLAVTRALRGRLDTPGDLEAGIRSIQRLEAAEATMADVLPPEAIPPSSARRAAAYRQAQEAHASARSLADAQGAQAISDAAPLPLASAQTAAAAADHAATAGAAKSAEEAAAQAERNAAFKKYFADKGLLGDLAPAEQEASAAAEAAAPTPPGAAPVRSGLAGHALDAAAALDLLSMLHVPGLPSARDIPVIGPLLSWYLKARAVGAVWRRLGGKIPGSVDGSVAARAAALRNRVTGAIGTLVTGVDRAAKAVAPAAPLAAVVLSHRLFADERDARHRPNPAEPIGDMLARRADELERAQRPGALAASLRDRVRTADPELAQEIVAGAQRRIDYLAAEIPRPPPGTPLGTPRNKWQPPPSETNRFARIVDALDNPAGVLERAIGGDVSIDQVKAIRTVYPPLYSWAQGQLLETLVGHDGDIPHARLVQLGYLFDLPLDATQEPSFVAKQQAGLASAGQPAQGGRPPTPSAGPFDLSRNMTLQEMRQ